MHTHVGACKRATTTNTTTTTTFLMQITRLCPADRLDPVALQRQDSCCLAATDWLLDFVTWMPPLPSVPALIYRTMTAKANTAASILLNTVTEPVAKHP